MVVVWGHVDECEVQRIVAEWSACVYSNKACRTTKCRNQVGGRDQVEGRARDSDGGEVFAQGAILQKLRPGCDWAQKVKESNLGSRVRTSSPEDTSTREGANERKEQRIPVGSVHGSTRKLLSRKKDISSLQEGILCRVYRYTMSVLSMLTREMLVDGDGW